MITEQEIFWMGDFGDAYTERNLKHLGSQLNFFSKIFSRMSEIESIYEIGTNRGMNLDAIKALVPNVATNGIEINAQAHQIVNEHDHNVELGSVLEVSPKGSYDLIFTRGVLIHIDPNSLDTVYEYINSISSKYILIDEYFSPVPVSVDYRGNNKKLFKRDFAKELMDKFDLELVDYGFTWKEDPYFPADNSNWFLFRK